MFVLFFLGTQVEVPWCKGIAQLTFFQKFLVLFLFQHGTCDRVRDRVRDRDRDRVRDRVGDRVGDRVETESERAF